MSYTYHLKQSVTLPYFSDGLWLSALREEDSEGPRERLNTQEIPY